MIKSKSIKKLIGTGAIVFAFFSASLAMAPTMNVKATVVKTQDERKAYQDGKEAGLKRGREDGLKSTNGQKYPPSKVYDHNYKGNFSGAYNFGYDEGYQSGYDDGWRYQYDPNSKVLDPQTKNAIQEIIDGNPELSAKFNKPSSIISTIISWIYHAFTYIF